MLLSANDVVFTVQRNPTTAILTLLRDCPHRYLHRLPTLKYFAVPIDDDAKT